MQDPVREDIQGLPLRVPNGSPWIQRISFRNGPSFQWTLPLLAIYRKPGVSILMTRKCADTFTTPKFSNAEINLRTELTYIIYGARLTCKVYVWITSKLVA